VGVAQGVGIGHVQTDVLCITQGNRNMGDVYYNATLLVAALGAKDSSEGLFVSERTISTFLRLPYKVTGEYRGAFNMTQLPD
jgi:hypothetical protein